MERPSRLLRFYFWFLLAVFSTFFAEVTVGSAPLVFWNFDGWLITVPVYGLHILVLSPLIIRHGRVPAWQAIYLTGAIVGLYEAYMTKILWAPTWNLNAFRLGGVAVLETLMLVLFWHPVMAFLVPLIFSEKFLHLQPGIIQTLSPKWKAQISSGKFFAICGSLAGFALGSMLADPPVAAGATVLNSLLILLLLWIWKKRTHNRAYYWNDLLPNKLPWIFLSLLLFIDFLLLGIWIRPEAIPSFDKQFTIWFLYIILGCLVFIARKHQTYIIIPPEEVRFQPEQTQKTLKHWLILSSCFCITSIFSSYFLAPIKNYVFLIIWTFGIPTGIYLFNLSLRWVFTKYS
jgi:hypothetical protein